MIAHSVAQCFVTENKKTLLICHGGPAGIQYGKIDETINKTDLGEEFNCYPVCKSMYHCKGLDILLWDEEQLEKNCIHPRVVKELLENLKRDYQVIVIDSGSDFYSGLAVGNLEEAQVNYVITTQQRSSLLKLETINNEILIPMGIEARLLINKFIDGAFATERDIMSKWNFKECNTIRYCGYGWEAEQEQSTLLKYPKYYRDFRKYEKTI